MEHISQKVAICSLWTVCPYFFMQNDTEEYFFLNQPFNKCSLLIPPLYSIWWCCGRFTLRKQLISRFCYFIWFLNAEC